MHFLKNVFACVRSCLSVCVHACVRVSALEICVQFNSKLARDIKFIFGVYMKCILKLSKLNYIVDRIILSIFCHACSKNATLRKGFPYAKWPITHCVRYLL